MPSQAHGHRPKATLDTNCLLAVSGREPGHEAVVRLLGAHERGQIELRLVAISATDLIFEGGPVQTYLDFCDWVSDLGFGGLEIVYPLAIYGVGFYGTGLSADAGAERLYEAVGKILFPHVYPPSRERVPSRNRICDVLMMWSHIFHKGDIFVTTDANFSKATKKPALQALGAGAILAPARLLTSLGA